MYFKQFYLNCLAHASYLIGSDGEAAVVDPQRDVEQYVAEAEAQGLKIKYVIETHLHADFMCGRNISKETSSTIGQQRKFNYALQPMPKEEFVRMMTTALPEAPAYFPVDAEINRGGAVALEELPEPDALSPEEVNRLAKLRHTILDVRAAAAFGAGHVTGAVHIGVGGQFASWAGTLVPVIDPIFVVAYDGLQ